MSDSKADDGKRSRLKEWLKRLLVSHFDGALVAGQKHRDYVSSLGIPLSRSRVGFDVIDVEFFSRAAHDARTDAAAVRRRFGLPESYVLCVSRFVRRKNINVVLEAFAESGLAEDKFLVLVGDGPLEAEVRSKIEELRIAARVRIFAQVLNVDMPSLYALAEFSVLASAYDQWGLCINEAMAAGLPVIVTETCGCANELVRDNVNGFVIRPGDKDALARKMRQLSRDEALREAFSQKSSEYIRDWTPVHFASNMLELVEKISKA